MLEFEGVRFSYPASSGLIENLCLSLDEGSFTSILGANGSGKSTILKLGCGMLGPSEGSVRLWGKPLSSYKNKDRAKLIGHLPQILDMNVPFTAGELAGMGAYPYDIAPALSPEEALRMVGLSGKRDSYVGELSGGERRRAFIAMTLVQGAGILLLDEPLSNLDIKYRLEIIRLLRAIGGLTVLMALHDINMAFRFDRVIVVKEGKILGAGPPEETLTTEMLGKAFDTGVVIRKEGGRPFMSYGEP